MSKLLDKEERSKYKMVLFFSGKPKIQTEKKNTKKHTSPTHIRDVSLLNDPFVQNLLSYKLSYKFKSI